MSDKKEKSISESSIFLISAKVSFNKLLIQFNFVLREIII